MTIAQRGAATTATNANVLDAGTLACNKPTGVVDGDVLFAWVTRNDRSLTMPSGWTQVDEEQMSAVGPPADHFATTLCSHVAASDGASYTWTVNTNGTGTGSPVVITIVAFSGVDNVYLIGGENMVSYNTDQAEPLTTGTVTNLYGRQYQSLYCRSARTGSATVPTFSTVGAASELSDVGIFSGGSVSYGQAVYLATSTSTVITAAALSITCAATDTHDVTTIMTMIDARVLPNPQYVNNPDTYGTSQTNRRASRW